MTNSGRVIPTADDVFNAVVNNYWKRGRAAPENEDELSEIIEEVRSIYMSHERRVTGPAAYCISRYVDSELDFTAAGSRGLGRSTDHVPRFAAKHRKIFQSLKASEIDEFRSAISRHIVCGYLLFEIAFQDGPVSDTNCTNASLFDHWVPHLYQPPEVVMQAQGSDDSLRATWFTATSKDVHDIACRHGIEWDHRDTIGTDGAIITHYFTAGATLRYIEGQMNETHSQLDEPTDGWPRLPRELLSSLPEPEGILIREHEEETIAASKMQLADVCENCHIKPQFAKTYRVLRRDLRDTLSALRLAPPPPSQSDVYMAALVRSTDAIISHKLGLMAQHFLIRWEEPIENWSGKEGSLMDRSGCLLFLAAAGTAAMVWLT